VLVVETSERHGTVPFQRGRRPESLSANTLPVCRRMLQCGSVLRNDFHPFWTTVGLAAASAAPVLARPRGPTSLSSVASPRRACCSCAYCASPK
jgi:hypothetical protein